MGLFSHGIGIGAFVYLRRIIESLVFDKFKEVSNTIEINTETFKHSEFKEKIDILGEHLPKILVQNKNIYSIVSKGIHELTEDECIEYKSRYRIDT
ncbi:hypothetical protein KQI42_19065 [Tissierella sp. MSJ-40]|uniref:Uncharacterized protein n=1 Tax=Tissierella simiarum TaxID=2841534 RepID=A0ABS6EAY9_9FIRM|nr:hypothetical protein [Tissierella simiarum]MBU5440098.1 hypothetical protein [Tissierella simiarum]